MRVFYLIYFTLYKKYKKKLTTSHFQTVYIFFISILIKVDT